MAKWAPMLSIDDLLDASFAESVTTFGDVGVRKCLLADHAFSKLAHDVFDIDLDSIIELRVLLLQFVYLFYHVLRL